VPLERALHKRLEDAKLRRIQIHDLRGAYLRHYPAAKGP
jgi:hypothetical protein